MKSQLQTTWYAGPSTNLQITHRLTS